MDLKGLVLDLRGNPGGLLDAAVEIASYLVPSKSDIVSAKSRNGEEVIYRSVIDPIRPPGMKLAVMVSVTSEASLFYSLHASNCLPSWLKKLYRRFLFNLIYDMALIYKVFQPLHFAQWIEPYCEWSTIFPTRYFFSLSILSKKNDSSCIKLKYWGLLRHLFSVLLFSYSP